MEDAQSRLTRHRAEVSAGYLAAARRVQWSADRLAAHRERALRAVLEHARRHSPFHAERLADVDPASFTEDQLPSLPTMSKADLVSDFAATVTDPRLTAASVQRHVDEVETGHADPYLFGEYRVLVTSGSSGIRGKLVYGWDEWTAFALMTARTRLSLPEGSSGPSGRSVVSLFGSFFGRDGTVLSSAILSFLGDPDEPFVHLPATLPLPELVRRINVAQPVLLRGYPSVIDLLTAEARAGRLHISPRYVETGAEILPERTRRQVRELWGVEIDDCWALTEGVTAVTCQGTAAMHLPDDFVIVEPVDEAGAVVPAGVPAVSFLLTSLYRFAQPLIRYRVEDSLTLLDGQCACGSAHRRIADLVGRKDVLFDYGPDVLVHAYLFGLTLDRDPAVRQFQVRQTRNGVALHLVTDPGARTDLSEQAVRDLLAGAGLANPVVKVVRVERIERLPTGKLQRFVPLVGPAGRP